MKLPNVGDYFKWKGKIAKIIWRTDQPVVGFEIQEDSLCPHCGKPCGKETFSEIPTSEYFKLYADRIQTLEVEP